MEIRKMTMEDIDDYKHIYIKAFEYRSDDLLDYYPKFSEYYGFFVDKGYSFILLNDDNIKCGIITAYELPEMEYGKTMFIETLAVLPEEQGKGYGKALINAVEQAASENGIKELSLRTACYKDAYLIYRHLDFKDQRSDSRYMTRRIKPSE